MTKKFLSSCVFILFCALTARATAVNITGNGGWFESAYVTWQKTDGLQYNVYVSPASANQWTKLDDELVREYPDYGRADALGLKAGSYQLRVVPVSNGSEVTADAATTPAIEVRAHDRSGFAHVGMPGGIGAYKSDGTLKAGAKVIYVWADNAKTVTHDVVTSSKGTKTTANGLQDIITFYQKGYDTTPLAIRIIGTIKAEDMDRFDSGEGLQVKGNGAYSEMPITFEGVGNDAAFWGFGILCRNCKDTEFRNFAIMYCMDDALSIDTNNSNLWIHNMDLFYGQPGSDADQAKGDGTVDVKGKSKNITVSYNHFYDSGKCSLGGMKSETTDCWMSYHHNWFDHSDSRHPRIRTAFYHVYNNYFDGVSKYGVGVTMGGSAFVEANDFRNTKYPMLISKQGTDAEGAGTFSGEAGGVIKAYNNKIEGARKLQYWSSSVDASGQWDAVLVNSRDEAVSAKALTGATPYNSAADQAARTTYIENRIDDPANVRAIVKGDFGAGRMQHGDFQWTFNNAVQDANYGVIEELKSAIVNYKSTLIGFFGGATVSNGGNNSTVEGGDGQGISDEDNENVDPSWGSGGTSGGNTGSGDYIIGASNEYFWLNEANQAAYNAYVADGTFATTGTFNKDREVTNTKIGSCSDYIGSVLLSPSQSFTVYCADGISFVNFYVSSNGLQNWKLETSEDGTTWKDCGTVTGSTGGHPACAVSGTEATKYARITNNASGTRDVQGIKVAKPGEGTDPDVDPADDEPTLSSDATADFLLNGDDIAMSGNAYTLNVAYDADDAKGYTVSITPAEGATVAAVTGATSLQEGLYTIAAPAAGQTQTATFRMLAENKANTRTYTINIVKGVDPATMPVTDGEFTYFPEKDAAGTNSFYTISGKVGDPKTYGSTTYVHNGETMQCTYSLKLESETTITFTPAKDGILQIGMATTYKQKDLKLNGTTLTPNANNVVTAAVKGGTKYTISKAGTSGLFYIDLDYVLRGDADGNGTVELADLAAMSDHLVGKKPATFVSGNADIDGNGKVDIADIAALIKLLTGK